MKAIVTKDSFTLLLLIPVPALLIVYAPPEITLWHPVPLDLLSRFQPPSPQHWFGTDWLGRDIFMQTLQGLAGSLQTGLVSALLVGFMALLMAVLGQLSKLMEAVVNVMTNALMAMPHLLLLILISFALGGERQGIIIAIALTHWPKLSRILSVELLQLRQAHWVKVSSKLGKSGLWISRHHLLPHILPQLLVGTALMIPHAILTASAMTFLGFGLSSEQPDIGVMLAEAMPYTGTGFWWSMLLPGLILVSAILATDRLVCVLKRYSNPVYLGACRT